MEYSEPDLRTNFGNIDIYLFDQLLKGRIKPDARILDAGCGGGRNLVWLLKNGFHVWGIDRSAEAIAAVQELAHSLVPDFPDDRFRTALLEELPFEEASFDVVICNAVLHFARDEEHFCRMIDECWRTLAPGGLFFTRLASTIGVEDYTARLHGRHYLLRDGTERFLVDEEMLRQQTGRLGGELVDPIKTTVVERIRSMTTWVIRKKG